MQASLTLVLLSFSVVLLSGLAVVGWQNRSTSSVKIFAVLEALSAVWAGMTTVGLSLPPGPLRIRVWGVATGMSLFVVVVWLAFILSYTGRERWLTSPSFGVIAVPPIVGGTLYLVAPSWAPLVGSIDQVRIPAGTVVQSNIGAVGAVIGASVYLVFLAGLVVVLKTVLEGDQRFTGQAIALVLGSMVTIVASAIEIVGVPAKGYPVTEVALSGQALLWGYAVFRQQFLTVVPAAGQIGKRAVFAELDDGVLVVDAERNIIRANPRAKEQFDGVDEDSVESLFEGTGIDTLEDLPARFQRRGRTFQAKASSLTNWRGGTVGHALVVRDVTQLARRQQLLQVLNRILRHNVRNDMSVVLGVGERLEEREDAELAALGETLSEQAYDLVTISEKALDIEKVFNRAADVRSVDPTAVVEDVVAPLAERHPDARIDTNVTTDELQTDRWVLSLVLEELVENALIHAGDRPEVEVEIASLGDETHLKVIDDGPGIPSGEVEPILSGEVTDLEHASSLGLWMVYWGTRSLGGDIEITTTEDGSVVTVSIPGGQPSDDDTETRTSSAEWGEVARPPV